MTQIVAGLAIALVVSWLVLAAILFALRSPGQSLGDIARVLPDSLRLAASLYRDRKLPKSVRWRLRIALIYNIQPINLIPDFVPVIGFADNVAVLAWALRGVVRVAGPVAVAQHWKGSPAALATLSRALRLSAVAPTSSSETNMQEDAEAANPSGMAQACQSAERPPTCQSTAPDSAPACSGRDLGFWRCLAHERQEGDPGDEDGDPG